MRSMALQRATRVLAVLTVLMFSLSAGAWADEKWALLVGICDYQSAQIPKLKGCHNDAMLVKQLLVEKAGFKEDHVMVIKDATKASIQAAWKQWLVDKPGQKDMAFFFYSGHGVQLDVGGQTHEALVPVDANLEHLESFILDDELSSWIKQCRTEAKVRLLFDACHSGTGVQGKAVVLKTITKTIPPELLARRFRPRSQATRSWNTLTRDITGKALLLAACDKTQVAEDHRFEQDGQEHWNGLFTFALADVIAKMDGETIQTANFDNLLPPVATAVAAQREGEMTPVGRPEMSHELPFFCFKDQPPPAAAATTVLPASQGKPLRIAIKPFDGDSGGNVVGAVRDTLKNEAWLSIVADGSKDLVIAATTGTSSDASALAGPQADRLITGRANGRLEATVSSETGVPINTVTATSAQQLAGKIRAELRRSFTFGWLAELTNPSAKFHVRISVNGASSNGQFPTVPIGQQVRFDVTSEKDCYLTLIDVGTSGNVTVLFPNDFHKDNFVKAGQVITVPAEDWGFDITVHPPPGREMVKAIATLQKVDITEAFPQGKGFKAYNNVLAFRKDFINGMARAMKVKADGRKDLVIEQHATGLQWAEATCMFFIK